MSPPNRELLFQILQFLDEENFKETVHKLEQESGFYFNMKYFEEEVLNGNWDEVEKYLCGFTKVDDNKFSLKIFYTIHKQKYLEALDKHDRAKAVEILIKDLKVLASSHEDLYKDLTQLLTLENFRENKALSMYEDTKSARAIVLVELKKIIEVHPLLCDKLQSPTLKSSTLVSLINQSLNWQHQQCKNPSAIPENKTIFVDHTCGQPNGAPVPPPAKREQAALLQKGSSPVNGDDRGIVDSRPRRADESTEISEPAQCRSLGLMDNLRSGKIFRLVYTNSGVALLALASNAIHLFWKWPRNEHNSSGKATTSVSPQLWQPPNGILMTNDVNDITNMNHEDAVHCFALSKNDGYVMSASGGKISFFNTSTFKTIGTFMRPPPAATYLEFHPQDNHVIAIGMENSTIRIFNAIDKGWRILEGHLKKITGLAFSNLLNVLVSSGADAQICVWSTKNWKKKKNIILPMPSGKPQFGNSDTRVQFHRDQVHFLVVHETRIAIFEPKKLNCIIQWGLPHENAVPVTHATFSCDCQLVYATFKDATVCIFNGSNLKVSCRILPSAYLPPNRSANVYPSVIAAHPSEPNQFALGLTDGGVYVLEPVESEATWGVAPPPENGSTSSLK